MSRSVRLNGEKLKAERVRQCLSRAALAARATKMSPISVATIKRAENGMPILLDRARGLASLLGVEVSSLL